MSVSLVVPAYQARSALNVARFSRCARRRGRLWAALFRMYGRLRDDSVLGYRCDAPRTEAILLIVLTAAEHRLLNALGGHARRSAQAAGSD